MNRSSKHAAGELGHITDSAAKLMRGAVARMAALLHLRRHRRRRLCHPVAEHRPERGHRTPGGVLHRLTPSPCSTLWAPIPVLSRPAASWTRSRDNGWEDVTSSITVLSRPRSPPSPIWNRIALLEERGYLRSYQPERSGGQVAAVRHPVCQCTPVCGAPGGSEEPARPLRTNRKIRNNPGMPADLRRPSRHLSARARRTIPQYSANPSRAPGRSRPPGAADFADVAGASGAAGGSAAPAGQRPCRACGYCGLCGGTGWEFGCQGR